MDVQLVKQQGMRLKHMKYAPKAELTPMRGLRPSGPGTEEGRISLADQDHRHQQDAEQSIQQEETLEEDDHQPATEGLSQSSATVARTGIRTCALREPILFLVLEIAATVTT